MNRKSYRKTLLTNCWIPKSSKGITTHGSKTAEWSWSIKRLWNQTEAVETHKHNNNYDKILVHYPTALCLHENQVHIYH